VRKDEERKKGVKMDLIIFKDNFKALQELGPVTLGKILLNLMAYLEGKENYPYQLSGANKAILELLKAGLERAQKRSEAKAEAGKKGALVKLIRDLDPTFHYENQSLPELESLLEELRGNKEDNEEKGETPPFTIKEKGEEANQDVKELIAKWNKTAEELGLPKVLKDTSERKKKIKRRIKNNKEFPTLFLKALEEIKHSSFLQGKNRNNWKITFDWLIENDSRVLKVVEGNYRDSKSPSEGSFLDLSKIKLDYGVNINKTKIIDTQIVKEENGKVDSFTGADTA